MTIERLIRKHNLIHTLIEATQNEKLLIESRFLRGRIISSDSYVTLLGETSSGKSTLINGLLKKKMLRTSSAPTTGTVVEIAFDGDENKTEIFAINRDATKERVDQATFDSLSMKPDDALARLQLVVPAIEGFKGMRLFDTPGYGSILEKHDEILSEFIPNSDVVIYVVGYKIGIQDNDFNFMRYMQELISDDTEVIIVVNRCPATITPNDKRLREICDYVENIFHKKLPVMTVSTAAGVNGEVLPRADELWDSVRKIISSAERERKLMAVFDAFLDDLLMEADNIVEKYKLENLLSAQHKKFFIEQAKELREKSKTIIENELIPVYERLKAEAPADLRKVRNNIVEDVCNNIDNESRFRMEETIVFVNQHLLPMATEREMYEYKRKLQLILDDLNDRVDNYLNDALAEYYHKLEVQFSSNMDVAIKNGAFKILGKAADNGLRRYLSSYGGRGGAGAGVANAAKHLLKKAGDLVGKKFSRGFHNNVARMLKKLGGTSIKNLGNVITVVIELLSVLYDYSTWKGTLKGKVSSGMDSWYTDTVDVVLQDLEKSKIENCEEINNILNNQAMEFESESENYTEKLPELIALCEETHRKLEEL